MGVKEELEKELEATKGFVKSPEYDLGTSFITIDRNLLDAIKTETLTKEQLKTKEYVSKIFNID